MPHVMSDLQGLVIPAIVPLTWLTYAQERGLDTRELIRATRISNESAASFHAGIRFDKFIALAIHVIERLGDDGIGFEIGWRMPLTAYGSLGYAILASATTRNALELCQRYWLLVSRGSSSFDIDIHEGVCVLTLSQHISLLREFEHIPYESSIASFYRGLVALMPAATDHIEVSFNEPEPAYGARIRERISQVRFGMPAVQLRFPEKFLDAPLSMSSAVGLRAALEQLNTEEKALGLQGTLLLQVQQRLRTSACYPTLDDMADLLGISARTLRRRMEAEGMRYSTLLAAARRKDAIRLLDDAALSVADVALKLGYFDTANFTRAFKKFTGMTPTEYRIRAQE